MTNVIRAFSIIDDHQPSGQAKMSGLFISVARQCWEFSLGTCIFSARTLGSPGATDTTQR
jgi:hypothetical protein